IEVDPRNELEIAKVNAERDPQFVTVKDNVDLPIIAAFRLLAARLQARHAILLKDVLVGAVDRNGPGRSGSIAPTLESPETLLTASTDIGSLVCDGIGGASFVEGGEAQGQGLRCG